MLKLNHSIYLFLAITFILSCGKNKSSDLPLPTDRKEAVYITTNNDNLISYNPFTGDKQWEVSLKGSSVGVPVMYKKKLYLVTNKGYFYSIDIIKGEIYLEKDIQKPTQYSLANDGDKLYLAAFDSLYCYDLAGVQLWQYDPGTPCRSSPQVVNGKVYVSAGDKIHSVIASSGGLNWVSISAGATDILSSVRVSNGLVYFGGQDQKIYALNESDGSLKWSYTTTDKVESSPLVYGGMCIVGSKDYGLYCIDTTSTPPLGQLRWKYPTGDRITSSPTVHESTNTILVGSYDFNLYAIDHVSGFLKWKYPAGSIIKSSPVVYGNNVYFTALDRYLYCVDVRDGSTIWKAFLNGTTDSSPMIDDMQTGLYPGISGMSKY